MTCKNCSSEPNKVVLVDDVKSPHCSECGKDIDVPTKDINSIKKIVTWVEAIERGYKTMNTGGGSGNDINSLNRDTKPNGWEEEKKKREYRSKWIDCAESFGYKNGGECLAFKTAWFCAVDMMFRELPQLLSDARREEREAICGTKMEEPPDGVEGLMDKRQAFLAGQMNMLFRIKFPALTTAEESIRKLK